MKRRELTLEENVEAARLQSAWLAYKQANPGTTQEWLAKEAGLGSQSAVGQYLRAIIPLNIDALLGMCSAIGADPMKISPRLAGKISGVVANMEVTPQDQILRESRNVFSSEDAHTVEIKRVKLKLSAGINRIQIEHCIEIGEPVSYTKEWLQRRGLFPEDLLALEVSGDSMSPGMEPGDVVVINMAEKVPKHNKIFAVNFDGQAVIKRLMFNNKNWFLYSDNPDQKQFPPHHCKSGECIPIGLVVDLRREF